MLNKLNRIKRKTLKLMPLMSINEGCLDGIINGHITGWISNKGNSPCYYEAFVNGRLVHQGIANKHRDDLSSVSQDGRIGFSISVDELIKDENIFFSDTLDIFISAGNKKITNNNLVIENNLAEYLNDLLLGGIKLENVVQKIKLSGLWEDSFYVNQHLQSSFKGDPLIHYVLYGFEKGYKVSPSFSNFYYNSHNPDVASSGIIPLYHYIVTGEEEGRKPNDTFSPKEYLKANPDLQNIDMTLLSHYLNFGIHEDRKVQSEEKNSAHLSSFELAKNTFFENSLIPTKNVINTKIIAYYLPQFHPFEQNDKWWGKSFTEWTNVTKAKPLLKNHEHPRLPTDLGFYDLRLKENIIEQAKMATSAGVEAFCLYYYWFNGTVLMDTPIEIIYNNKDIDIEYCICWANENWTKAWDGLDKEVLIEQTYSEEDDIDFISHISKYFSDERYVKVDGKPLIVIYRPSIFPDMAATIKRWRTWAQENGVGELQLTMVQFDDTDPNKYGFDASVEFPPHKVASDNVAAHMNFNEGFAGSVHDYSSMVNNSLNKVDTGYTCYKAVTMAWDNTARRNDRASIFTNVSSGKLQRWMSGIENSYQKNAIPEKDKLIFVNAWNEWAEGTYLEPDRDHGYSYLNAVSNFKSGDLRVAKMALLIHIFYDDLVEEIISYAKNIPDDFDILITCTHETFQTVSKLFNEAFPNSIVDIKVVPNKGRDIAPFLCNHAESYGRYDYICKIHSKKSLHADGIDNWRTYLYERLLGSEKQVNKILERFENDSALGLQYPEYSESIKPFISWGSNKELCRDFMDSLGLDCPDELPDFPAGSMFWFRPQALGPLLQKKWKESDFPEEKGQIDATIMHAVERCFLLILLNNKKFNYQKLKKNIC